MWCAADFRPTTRAGSDELTGDNNIPGLSNHFARLKIGEDTTTKVTDTNPKH